MLKDWDSMKLETAYQSVMDSVDRKRQERLPELLLI
jgi:hypothetical protein